jgi:hypothetical protein
MYRISSDARRLSTFVVPSLRAARRRHRLLRDLEPGSVTVPSRLLIGATARVSVSLSDAVTYRMLPFSGLTIAVDRCGMNAALLWIKNPAASKDRETDRVNPDMSVEELLIRHKMSTVVVLDTADGPFCLLSLIRSKGGDVRADTDGCL